MGYSKLTYEEYIEHPEQWGTELPLWAKELSEMGYPGVSAIDFYDDIFGEDLEEERLPEEYIRGEKRSGEPSFLYGQKNCQHGTQRGDAGGI